MKYRWCDNPTPAHGGRDCDGSYAEEAPCNTHHCNEYQIIGPDGNPSSAGLLILIDPNVNQRIYMPVSYSYSACN